MNKIMALLIFVVMALACEDAAGASIPKAQSDFCAIIVSTYNEWSEEVGKPAYIDQNANASAIKQKGKQRLKDFFAENNGAFMGWEATISALSVDADASNVGLSAECLCDASNLPPDLRNPMLSNMDASENQTHSIKKGLPVYEALRKFKVRDTVFVSGKFMPPDQLYDTDADIYGARCLVVFDGVGQTADESMAVAEENRRQALVRQQEQELAQQREQQEQELAREREKQEQELAQQRKKQEQELARERKKQEQAPAARQVKSNEPKSVEYYMENAKVRAARLKECKDKSELNKSWEERRECSTIYQAQLRIDEGEKLTYKSVEWYMENAKARTAKLKECEQSPLGKITGDCRNARSAEDRVKPAKK